METIVSTDKVRQYFITRQSILVDENVFTGVIASLSDITQALNMSVKQVSAALSTLIRLGELATSKLCPIVTATTTMPQTSKCHDSNESPTRSSSLSSDPNASLRSMVESLEQKCKQLETASTSNDNSSSDLLAEDLEVFMQQLHDYNEIKDIGQMLLGKCAEFEGCTIKEMHERFALHKEDMA
ncbi:Swi5-domain-containing protein [Syncephalis plumigaleata]|nr:Swi5-domain-containing protein [Syncephalis plumigaleata]